MTNQLSTNMADSVENAAASVFKGSGLDLTDNNYKNTPERFIKVLEEFTYALTPKCQEEIKENLAVQFEKHSSSKNMYRGMLVQNPIRAYSLCSHHLLPVIYDISFAYIPRNKLLGFSKIVRVIKLIAKKPCNQEDFTQELAETFIAHLQPQGLAIVVSGIHLCMKMRGVESGAINKTSVVKGDFKKYTRIKDEFLTLAAQFNSFSI